jgi:murein DD-endopeptidase MepM/ murein hydrolase activator NlpD
MASYWWPNASLSTGTSSTISIGPGSGTRQLSSYFTYRQPVLASADGTVVSVLDGLPNNPDLPYPPPIPPIDETVGNYVIVKLADNIFLLYAHLDPGSVRVSVGEAVSRGQVLGVIGTSGNSTVPHLHFQVMTTPTFFPTDSPPYLFDHFDLVGQVTERIWDDILGLQPSGTLPYSAAPDAGARTNQMPLDRNVIRVRS